LYVLNIIQKYASRPGQIAPGFFVRRREACAACTRLFSGTKEGQPGHAITRQGLLDQTCISID